LTASRRLALQLLSRFRFFPWKNTLTLSIHYVSGMEFIDVARRITIRLWRHRATCSGFRFTIRALAASLPV